MNILVLLAALAALAYLSALCSGTETAFYRVSPVRLRAAAAAGDRSAVRAEKLRATLPRLVNELLIGNNIVTYLATAAFAALWAECGFTHAAVWTTILLTPSLFVLGEVTPKQLACATADAWAPAVARVFQFARVVLAPLAAPVTALTGLVRRGLARWDAAAADTDPRARLLAWFESGVEDRALTAGQHRMTRRIIALSAVRVAELAVPVAGTCAVPETATGRETLASLAAAGPGADAAVLLDAAGRPTGKVAELNALWRNPAGWDDPVGPLARAAPVLSPRMSLADMLVEFGRSRTRIALVGQPGHFTGVVTARALLARILT